MMSHKQGLLLKSTSHQIKKNSPKVSPLCHPHKIVSLLSRWSRAYSLPRIPTFSRGTSFDQKVVGILWGTPFAIMTREIGGDYIVAPSTLTQSSLPNVFNGWIKGTLPSRGVANLDFKGRSAREIKFYFGHMFSRKIIFCI